MGIHERMTWGEVLDILGRDLAEEEVKSAEIKHHCDLDRHILAIWHKHGDQLSLHEVLTREGVTHAELCARFGVDLNKHLQSVAASMQTFNLIRRATEGDRPA